MFFLILLYIVERWRKYCWLSCRNFLKKNTKKTVSSSFLKNPKNRWAPRTPHQGSALDLDWSPDPLAILPTYEFILCCTWHYIIYLSPMIRCTWYTHYITYLSPMMRCTWYTHYTIYLSPILRCTWYTHYITYLSPIMRCTWYTNNLSSTHEVYLIHTLYNLSLTPDEVYLIHTLYNSSPTNEVYLIHK